MILQNSKIKSIKLGGGSVSKVMLNNQQIYPTESLGIDPSQSVAGDYAFYNREKVCIIPNDTDLTTLPENYIPIGVVVVPGTHNVYGDGSCGVMSLKPMSCDAPSTGGTSEQNMSWGVYGTNISVLPNLDQVPTGNTSNGIPTGQTHYAYLPSDRISDTQCAHDTDAYYYFSPYIPSPYLTDGSRNPGYYQTSSPSSAANALADFDGIGNTEK